MKKYTLTIVLSAILAFSMSAQQVAEQRAPEVSSVVLLHNLEVTSSKMITCDGVLPNYTNSIPNSAGGVTSQDFEITFNAYDNMAADDFLVPGTGESTICQVYITGFLNGSGFIGDPDSKLILRLFENDGELPGTLIYTENFPTSVDDKNDGSFVLELTEGPALSGGTTYWLSVQAFLNGTIAGQWFWSTATDGNGKVYAWQNPLDGFGFGCVTWSPHTNCSLSPGPDLMMDISFNESLATNSISLETAVTIYPNPVKDQFTLQSDVSLEKLTIYDILGILVSNVDLSEMEHEKTVDISSLAPGVYMVRIIGDKGSVVKNLVKR